MKFDKVFLCSSQRRGAHILKSPMNKFLCERECSKFLDFVLLRTPWKFEDKYNFIILLMRAVEQYLVQYGLVEIAVVSFLDKTVVEQ